MARSSSSSSADSQSQLTVLLNQVRYNDQSRVQRDITALSREYRSLSAKIGSLMQNNGAECRAIVLSGTIPIFYQMNQYNIPIDLYVMPNYPTEPPQIYVRPTSNMLIKSQHQHVDMQGLVYLPYLHEWSSSCSNLIGLVEITCQVFSISPPLFAKPLSPSSNSSNSNGSSNGSSSSSATTAQAISAMATAAVAYPSSSSSSRFSDAVAASASPAAISATPPLADAKYMNTHWTNFNDSSSGSGSGSIGMSASNPHSSSYAAAAAAGFSSSGASQSPAEREAAAAAAAAKQKRLSLVDQATMTLYLEIDAKQRLQREAILREFANAHYLERNHELSLLNRDDVQRRTEQSSEALKAIEFKQQQLQQWTAQQEELQGTVDCESLIRGSDALSDQIADITGELNAIDDAFYFLERALTNYHNDDINVDTFLKESRQLARRQFMNKVHLKKIAAYCEQQQQQQQYQQQQQQQLYLQQQQQPQQQYYQLPQPQYSGSVPPHYIQSRPAI